ncbi:MAG: iron ABC transporter permease, partial [Hyphomicrobium sp.]
MRDTTLASALSNLARWRARRRSSPLWTAAVAFVVLISLAPVASIAVMALASGSEALPHLVATVLPSVAANTLLLAILAGALTLVTGTAAAWLVTMYRFPGRGLVDRLLVLPLAVPAYIVAYCYADLLDYAGPVQTALRSAFGWHSPADYWFPQVRSTGGAALIIASVLYPYVYLAARASFVQQSVCALEVARTLGRTPMGTFWAIALPLARPALAAGVALVLMEVLNEFGAVRHLGVVTLSTSIYDTWLQRSDLGGASQLAFIVLIVVIMLLAAERRLRGGAMSHHTTGRYRSIPFHDIEGWKGWAAAGLCAAPFVAGFAIPAALLMKQALKHGFAGAAGGFAHAAWNSAMLAGLAAVLTVFLALLLNYARRVAGNGLTRIAVRAAGFGYAVPGTVLALGLLVPLAGLDNWIDAQFRSVFGVSPGLLLSGSIFALTMAYVIRFLAVALGGVEAGFERISPNLDAAARTLGETALSALRRVHLPMLLPSLGAAGLLVFVDTMKELPATLLLRPFDFETLATNVYGFASLEQVEMGAASALAIVATGLIPVLFLHKAVAGGRSGHSG